MRHHPAFSHSLGKLCVYTIDSNECVTLRTPVLVQLLDKEAFHNEHYSLWWCFSSSSSCIADLIISCDVVVFYVVVCHQSLPKVNVSPNCMLPSCHAGVRLVYIYKQHKPSCRSKSISSPVAETVGRPTVSFYLGKYVIYISGLYSVLI